MGESVSSIYRSAQLPYIFKSIFSDGLRPKFLFRVKLEIPKSCSLMVQHTVALINALLLPWDVIFSLQ
jgi:hypothetical protein